MTKSEKSNIEIDTRFLHDHNKHIMMYCPPLHST